MTPDEQIQFACGTAAPGGWTEQQKDNWLKRESQAQQVRVMASINEKQSSGKSLPTVGGAAGYHSKHLADYLDNQYNDGRVPQLQQRRAVLLAYLREKLADDDMHGVQDAASDIREIDAKLSVLRA